MQRLKSVFGTFTSLALSLPWASAFGLFLLEPAAAQSTSGPLIYPDQGRSQAAQEKAAEMILTTTPAQGRMNCSTTAIVIVSDKCSSRAGGGG